MRKQISLAIGAIRCSDIPCRKMSCFNQQYNLQDIEDDRFVYMLDHLDKGSNGD